MAAFLYGLGIPGFGVANAKLIVKAYKSDIEAIINAKEEDLVEIDQVGDVLAHDFVSYFSDEKNLSEVRRLLDEIEFVVEENTAEQDLDGMTFVITGSLEQYPNRDALKKEIEAQMRRYFELGLAERHLDSHHHVHTDRSVMQVLMPLVQKYDFKSVRLSRNLFVKMNPLKKIYKDLYNNSLKSKLAVTSDYFGSYEDLKNTKDNIRRDSLVEVMVHPMYDKNGILVDSHSTPMSEIDMLLDELRAERQAYYLS
jgi:hypothetical protein